MLLLCYSLFFFHLPAATEIYTLSLHDALPISSSSGTRISRGSIRSSSSRAASAQGARSSTTRNSAVDRSSRSEEHTSELQSHSDLVCRLLLEKKNRRDCRVRSRERRSGSRQCE